MALGSGCGNDVPAPPDAAEEPRDDEITATIDALWDAVGIDRSAVAVGLYDYRYTPDSRPCADLAREDRWFATRASLVPPDVIAQQDLETAIVTHLEDEGFTVERYRSTLAADPTRAFRAVRDELVVYGHLSDGGAADVNVRAGPCAPDVTTLDPQAYEIDR